MGLSRLLLPLLTQSPPVLVLPDSLLSKTVFMPRDSALKPCYLGSNPGLDTSSYDSVLMKLWVGDSFNGL